MLRLLFALMVLFALPAAQAADLDLKVISDGIGPVSITLHDVKPGKLASVDLPGADGRSIRLDLRLAASTSHGEPIYKLAIKVTKRWPDGRSRVQEEVSRPTLRLKPDEDAEVFKGSEAVACTASAQYRYLVNYYKITARLGSGSPAQ